MSTLPAKTILKEDPRFAETPDFRELRKRGLEHVAALSGSLWTDHNLHDPGITLLEVLCYALTDLGYRTSLDEAELFAPDAKGGQDGSFFTPAEILTNNPVTVLDYRKMLVDIPGVRNAWIEKAEVQEVPMFYTEATTVDCAPRDLCIGSPSANDQAELQLDGLYRVLLDIDPLLTGGDEDCRVGGNTFAGTLEEVNRRLHAHRNLCEDFMEVEVLADEEIRFCLDLDLAPKADPTQTLTEVLEAIEEFISPRVRFASLKELLDEEKPLETIFRGRPYLPAYEAAYGIKAQSHGFVDSEELQNIPRRQVLRTSDLYRVIMDVPSVRAIRELKIGNILKGKPQTDGEEWELPLTEGHRPLFAPAKGTYKFHKGNLRVPFDSTSVIDRFLRRLADYRKIAYKHADLDRPIPYGRHRKDLGKYYSVQHELPSVYGIGEGELSLNATTERQAQVKQLRGFLSFFDQLMANYCYQLFNTRRLYSWLPGITKTSFSQPVVGAPGAAELLRFSTTTENLSSAAETVYSLIAYDHPLNRDQAMAAWQNEFNQLSLDGLRERIRVVEGSNGRFHYEIVDALSHHLPQDSEQSRSVLRGAKDYRLAESAETASMLATIQLLAKGGDAANYRADNYQVEHRYGFTILDGPVDQAKFLDAISESPSISAERRNKVLDQLLSRFNEQFTDYVLLMYALNKKAHDADRIIKDKERFLANYPKISRERGKGFDYLKPELAGNVSGVEQRVGALIGLNSEDRPELSPFSVHLLNQQNCLVWKDHRGRVLLRSTKAYAPGADLIEAKAQLLERLADHTAYIQQECLAESLYGYTLVDKKGTSLATFPATFSDAFASKESQACTLAYFCGLKRNKDRKVGIRLSFLSEEQGYFFTLTADDGATVYLKTAAIFTDEESVWSAGLALLDAARDTEAYRPTLAAGRYGFDLTDAAGHELGKHPLTYSTAEERDAEMTNVQAHFAERSFDYRPEQAESRFFWRICVPEDGPVLSSLLPFAEEQAVLRHWAAVLAELGDDVKSYVNQLDPDEYRVELRRNGGFVLAESQAYPDEGAARAAKEKLRVFLAVADEDSAGVVEETGDWGFELYLADELVLVSESRYPNETAMDRFFVQFSKLDKKIYSFQEIPDPDSCLYSFGIKDKEKIVARYPGLLTKEEIDELQKRVRRHFEEKAINCKIGRQDFRWTYRLQWEDCAGRCADLLVSEGDGWETEKEARKAASDLLTKLKKNTNLEDRENGPAYTFGVSQKGLPLAAHPDEYATPEARNAVRTDALSYLRDYFDLCDGKKEGFTEEPKIYVHCKSKPICCTEEVETSEPPNDKPVLGPLEDCVLSSFQLRKDNAPVATHPGKLASAADRDELIVRILAASRERKLDRYKHPKAGPQVQGEVEKQGNYSLREVGPAAWTYHLYAPDNGLEWLCSSACYPDENAAGRAYNLLLELLDHLSNYQTDDHPEAGIYRLIIVETLLEGRIAYADAVTEVTHPVICPAEYPFAEYEARRIVETSNADGTKEYSIEELKIPVQKDCGAPATKASQIRPKAWKEGLEAFLIEGTTEENYYEFLDGEQECGYGFRVVRPGYSLARSPRESHTSTEREKLLNWLYYYPACQPSKNELPYQLCYRQGGGDFRAVLAVDDEVEHWVATARFATVNEVNDYWEDNQVHLLNLAQQPDFYQARREPSEVDGSVRFRLVLINEKEEVVLESLETYERGQLANAVRERIRPARTFPLYVEEGDDGKPHYGFQCFSAVALPDFQSSVARHCPPTFFAPAAAPENEEETIVRNGILELNIRMPGEVIWESSQDYKSSIEARRAFNCFQELLADRRNLQRIQFANCNLFGLELTRPDYVLAEHPRRYAGPTDLAAAKARTLACINGEGLRLLEHLLLRPRSPKDPTIPSTCPAPPLDAKANQVGCPDYERWLLAITENEAEADSPEPSYVPGADPYSYWATVVLPYWPHNFQNANFRAFFEDSLRREAPAHVALKICWLDPLQMREFEQKHQRWLNTRGDAENCGRRTALKELIDFLAGMTSVFPPAKLQAGDCATAGVTDAGAVLLGSTQLS